eukprot:8145646-Ditylum_brightwellii.AAC.1
MNPTTPCQGKMAQGSGPVSVAVCNEQKSEFRQHNAQPRRWHLSTGTINWSTDWGALVAQKKKIRKYSQ